jgi:hypothetical protein
MSVSLGYMASHSRNLESLLQTYRQINLTTQSVFLVLGIFILSRILETPKPIAVFPWLLLVSLTAFSLIVMWKFQKVIIARGEDVNWWHRQIMMEERTIPPDERIFTRFKIFQSQNRLSPEETARFLEPDCRATEEDIRMLLDADLDHIRKVINRYILGGMRLMWILVAAIGTGSLFF